jgi:hypothetical protein
VTDTNKTRNCNRSILRTADTRAWATLALMITLCFLAVGCVAPKRAAFIVPRRCIKIDAQSFTRPCTQRADGKLLCDGVVATATCIEVAH